jgi:N-acetylneuraminic acid mutarotase
MDGRYQGVAAPATYAPPLYDLGDHKSSNGTIEYLADSFGGELRGAVLVANYSVGDDLTMLRLSADGRSVTEATRLVGGFDDPLPVAQDPDGTIYVGEFGAHRITVLVPDDDPGAWTARTRMPEAVLDAGGAALGGKLYSVAGKTSTGHISTVRTYDPISDAWSPAADLPGPAVENPAVVAMGTRLYAFGGATGPFDGAVANTAAYDPVTDTWTTLPGMPTARGGATAQVVGTRIFVVGGMDATGTSVDTVEVFDPATGSWAAAPPVLNRRDNPGSAVLEGKLYVFGGRTRDADGTGVDRLRSVEVYDPVTVSWTPRSDMPTARRTMVVGTLGGRAQVMGGERAADGNAFDANEEYDPLTDTWRVLAPLPTPRHGAAAGTIDGVVYVAGGGPVAGSSFTDANEAFRFGT